MSFTKLVVAACLSLAASGSFAKAPTSQQAHFTSQKQVQVYLKSFSIFHPELKLQVLGGSSKEILQDLKRLDEIINEGAPYQLEELINLTCGNPACGGGGGGGPCPSKPCG